MIVCRCIEKVRDKNKIVGYILKDSNGNTMQVEAEQLKDLMRKKEINVVNLHLTTDNRITTRYHKDVAFRDAIGIACAEVAGNMDTSKYKNALARMEKRRANNMRK